MKLPNVLSVRQTKRGIIVAVVVILTLGGAGYAYFGRNSTNQNVNNAGKTNTSKLQSPITMTNSSDSNAGVVDVPCACSLKNKQTQPGQSSTPASSLQNGSTGSVQIQSCSPCPTNGVASSATTCPEYVCKVPSPPTPVPTPTPTPGCGTCGGGFRKVETNSSAYMCPMYCVE
jgi:hypothetical protein